MIGHKVVNGVEMPLTEEDVAQLEAKAVEWALGAGDRVRQERDYLLLGVDAFVSNPLRWASLDAATQDAWVAYRQALLDVPEQAGFPNEVTWPTKP